MFLRNVQYLLHVAIGQGIIGVLSFLLKFNEIVVPENFQLMGNC